MVPPFCRQAFALPPSLCPQLACATLPRNDKFASPFTLHSSLRRKAAFTLAEGATHVALSHNIRRAAFTLAEVLITLGIIGVVAAITIPGMIVKHQKQIAAKRLEQTYSILSQAILHAQADYGDILSWGMVAATDKDPNNPNQGAELATAFAETYLAPYLKLSSEPLYASNIKNLGYVNPQTKDGRIYGLDKAYLMELTNGVTLFISYNGNSDVFSTPLIFVDINGKQNPNIVGRDWYMFYFDGTRQMKLKPFAYGNLDRETLKEYCGNNPPEEGVSANFYCTALIMFDGWEIKDDYPW